MTAGRIIGCSRQTVLRYAERGQLPFVRDAHGWRRFFDDDVARVAARRREWLTTKRGCRFCSAAISQRSKYCGSRNCDRLRQRWMRWRARLERSELTA